MAVDDESIEPELYGDNFMWRRFEVMCLYPSYKQTCSQASHFNNDVGIFMCSDIVDVLIN